MIPVCRQYGGNYFPLFFCKKGLTPEPFIIIIKIEDDATTKRKGNAK